jgi:hypothetical protein
VGNILCSRSVFEPEILIIRNGGLRGLGMCLRGGGHDVRIEPILILQMEPSVPSPNLFSGKNEAAAISFSDSVRKGTNGMEAKMIGVMMEQSAVTPSAPQAC